MKTYQEGKFKDMILIYGGAYNGKNEFVKKKYNLEDKELFYCNDSNLDFSYKGIIGLHIFIKGCILSNMDALEIIKQNLDNLQDNIIVCDEIGSGIVPLDRKDRLWREECGRVLQFLSQNSNKVCRIFFGLEEVLKDE
ncbi:MULTISPECIES: bifunctional adenosylcobinamide kinase/adenosylcobinamide-phosphate guanylyltransferase [unclassified Clostridium]|uniref:bifunctional adenosylcobinamide kinase/adenosylcobinamide-phosphate guanylyltransferase n=1 Tax=unclassified Clostridium TaxID=2614128 RepID=UPI0013FC33B0|nr:bifunctional adenosylcobinamide kinase/adenosylcobinamide-phosphate guanylyltransferase [Clostridium sp. RO3]MBN1039509.1 cobalamin biosynthesis protein CobU [Clostridium botulinum]MBN1046357.1 cobalamin biosynthesis protein CobU [Clostridium botulinum]NFR86373.1 cobalamin biosynthesis protein CobU [Clostridium botulinum]NFR91706.1 cobalamin biosynthesis protein CobU [Clostridium botulinum]NFU00220.1 cobalamin biosynthesis protein CobU [Clostridium botulinum]